MSGPGQSESAELGRAKVEVERVVAAPEVSSCEVEGRVERRKPAAAALAAVLGSRERDGWALVEVAGDRLVQLRARKQGRWGDQRERRAEEEVALALAAVRLDVRPVVQ